MYFYLNNFTKSKVSSVFVAEIKTISAKRLEPFILCFKLAMTNVKKMSKLGIAKQHFHHAKSWPTKSRRPDVPHYNEKNRHAKLSVTTCFINSL